MLVKDFVLLLLLGLILPLQSKLTLEDQTIVEAHLADARRDVQTQLTHSKMKVLTHRALFVRRQLVKWFAKDANDALQVILHAGTTSHAHPQILRIVYVARKACALIERCLARQQGTHLGHDLLVRLQITRAQRLELVFVAEVHQITDRAPGL